jgi:hypothetical protein
MVNDRDQDAVFVCDVAAENQSRTHFGGQTEINLPDFTALYS